MQTLSVEDEADLFALLKPAPGIPDRKNRKFKPLTAAQISAPVKLTTHGEFRAMKKLRQVTAIAENQPPASRLRGQGVQIGPVILESVGKWGMRGTGQADLRACYAPLFVIFGSDWERFRDENG